MSEYDPVPSQEPSTSLHLERRAYVRLASDLAATCRLIDRSREVGWPGTVRDISQGGVGLLVRHRFRPGTFLTLDLRDSTSKLLRTVQVRVIHATSMLVEGNHCWLLGCEFDQPLSEEEFQALV
jgi:hypothetical protein